MLDNPEHLSVRQRLKKYLWLAEQARLRAETMPTSDLQEGYLKLACDWQALAAAIERSTPRGDQPKSKVRDRLGFMGSAEDSTA